MLTKALLNTFFKNGGALARIISGLIVSGIVAALARFKFEMAAEDVKELSGVVFMLVAGVIGELVVMYQARSIKEMQTAIAKVAPEVHADGHAGQTTRSAVQRVAAFVETIQQDGFPPPAAKPDPDPDPRP